jgi:hypothetical protein
MANIEQLVKVWLRIHKIQFSHQAWPLLLLIVFFQ